MVAGMLNPYESPREDEPIILAELVEESFWSYTRRYFWRWEFLVLAFIAIAHLIAYR